MALSGLVLRWTKRLLVGRPMRSERLGETLLPKKLAMPVFCSDPLSSNAYATEEILRALSLGGLALLFLAPWVALAVVVLLAVVVASYRQTCYAYPTGGGAYAVSRANLGRNAALVAASALLVDYVLTVAVSVAAGVDAITSAFLVLKPFAVVISLGFVALLTLMNLRGVKESGTVFAIPTYGFIAVVFAMIGWGAFRLAAGDVPRAESASFGITSVHSVVGAAALLLGLRAFSQGCTALTGVEAVSNGVPNFKPPKSRNAADTLAIMGAITIAMFAGITALALVSRVRVVDDTSQLVGAPADYKQRTAIAQVAGAVFGYESVWFLLVQGFTAAILILAANTAYNGFPILASILGRDNYLPRQFGRRGDRLVFIAMPALFLLMKAIERHYRHVSEELAPEPGGMVLPSRIHAVVLVSRLHKPTLRALAYARATRPDTLTALTVASSPEDVRALQNEWAERGIPVPLTELDAPYRDITGPVVDHVAELRRASPRDLVVIYVPEYVVGHWWEHLLHNQSALRLKARLLFQRGVMVTSVPWQLASSRADERLPEPPKPQPVGTGTRTGSAGGTAAGGGDSGPAA